MTSDSRKTSSSVPHQSPGVSASVTRGADSFSAVGDPTAAATAWLERLSQELKSPFDASPSPTLPKTVRDLELLCAEACRYPLDAGGKRIRPLLLLSMAGWVGGDQAVASALPAASAIELIHTYSLVHDDLPSMDNDDLRRGRPTTHKVYGEPQALLVGDSLLTEAFGLLAQASSGPLSSALCERLAARAGARGMVLGQWLDIALTQASEVSWDAVERIHELKTGALLAASLEMGVLCGLQAAGVEPSEWRRWVEPMGRVGVQVGLAFQIVDDILDATRTSAELGKTAGKDAAQAKMTAVRLLGLEAAQKRAAELTLQARESLSLWWPALEQVSLRAVQSERLVWKACAEAMIDALLVRTN